MKTLCTVLAAVLLTADALAQTPEKMSYQAVIRNPGNNLVSSQSIGMQVSILKGSETGTVVYKEIYSPNPVTNSNGLLTIEIGSGIPVTGTYTGIDWANGPYFIKTEADPAGGTNYTIAGTSQLLSVPYALHAKTAETLSGGSNETDPVFSSSPAKGISLMNISNWDAAFGWGNHATAGYLKSGANNNNWQITGNAGTSSATNFIGTTDNTPLKFRTNNMLSGILDPTLENTGFGKQALIAVTSGTYNTAIGALSMNNITTGGFNVAVGYRSAYADTIGMSNVSIGAKALENNTTGNNNVAIGNNALKYNRNQSNNVAIGDSALCFNDCIGHMMAMSNTAIGAKALQYNAYGAFNTAIGYQALYLSDRGNSNTASGYQALYSNAYGGANTANGSSSLFSNTIGTSNTASGNSALYKNTSGNVNTASGYSALSSNTIGYSNTAIGAHALSSNISGSNNTALGYSSFYGGSEDFTNSTALGYMSAISASNQVRIGNGDITSIGGYANWSNISDSRFKKELQEDVPGLAFLLKLKPATYCLDVDKLARYNHTPDSLRLKVAEAKKSSIRQTGFIAQEVEQAAKSIGYNFSGVDAPKNENDYYSLRYAEFVVPLVKGMQEQQVMIEELKRSNAELQKMITLLMLRVDQLERK